MQCSQILPHLNLLAILVSAVAVGNNLPLRSLLHVRQDQVIDPNEIAPEVRPLIVFSQNRLLNQSVFCLVSEHLRSDGASFQCQYISSIIILLDSRLILLWK